ncbi:PRD domain-containing protein [Lactobacillus isalae]|uniref:PRD domain-containing protein n=1 Tax=Lactobacillus isalae TaxID=2993455 RepID=UPI0024A8A454|nr:PRD domain-containing protein [Lactobacillus isalae]
MRVEKKINNNVAVCTDGNGQELIALGRGIGFPKTPYELADLSKIDMTFYRVNDQTLELLKTIPGDVVMVSSQIVKEARLKIKKEFSPNIIFSLADHISFAIERTKRNEVFDFSLSYDIEHLYTQEYEIGQEALKIVKDQLGFELPRTESIAIAMHFINAQEGSVSLNQVDDQEIIDHILNMIISQFEIEINKKDFSYHRFILHLRYMLKRIKENNQISDNSSEIMLKTMIKENYSIYKCSKNIVSYIDNSYKSHTTDDEMFYLMVYINRIVSKNIKEVEKNG